VITVDEARDAVRQRAHAIKETERIPLLLALFRVLAAPVRADRMDPPFDRAAMDGYAVRADETLLRERLERRAEELAGGVGLSGVGRDVALDRGADPRAKLLVPDAPSHHSPRKRGLRFSLNAS